MFEEIQDNEEQQLDELDPELYGDKDQERQPQIDEPNQDNQVA